MQKVIVIDYGMGNLHSVQKALSFLGAAPVLSQNPEEIQAAEKLILPGVGAFADAMAELKQKNLAQAIKQAVKKYSLKLVNNDSRIVCSKLHEKAGIIGACMTARRQMFEKT